MTLIKRKKIFPGDVKSSTVPRDISNFTRIGQITGVNIEEGLCTVKWLDAPGTRNDVLITQSSPGEWVIPPQGAIVLIATDSKDQARLLRYINIGQGQRMTQTNTLPKFQEGEKFWETGGSYLYMRSNGDIVLSTLSEGYFIIENSTGSLKSETINWQVLTEAGKQYMGLIKRYQIAADGTNRYTTVARSTGELLTEYAVKIYETADGTLGSAESPVIEIMMGTLVSDLGIVTDKNGVPITTATADKEVAVRIKINPPGGAASTVLVIDKQGEISLQSAKLNINAASVDAADPDITKLTETNNTALGTRGQHVAREHDELTIPVATTYNDPVHKGLEALAASNMEFFAALASAFVSPNGPCTFNAAIFANNTKVLKGQITAGAENILIGDR